MPLIPAACPPKVGSTMPSKDTPDPITLRVYDEACELVRTSTHADAPRALAAMLAAMGDPRACIVSARVAGGFVARFRRSTPSGPWFPSVAGAMRVPEQPPASYSPYEGDRLCQDEKYPPVPWRRPPR
jgi:hypothetical protein